MQLSSGPSRLLSIFCGFTTLALVVLFYWHFADSPPRLAYVDTDRLLNSYQGMLDARRTYQREKAEWERNLQTLENEARQAVDALQRSSPGASAKTRSSLATAARISQQQFVNYRQAIQRQDPEEMQRLTQPVLEHTNKYLRLYGQQHGYDVVLATSEGGGLVYANAALDITTQVTGGLNSALQDSLKKINGK